MTGRDIRGTEETGLTVELVWDMGKALADWLPGEAAVAVTYLPVQDHVADAMIEGLRLQGRAVVSSGVIGTEAMKKYAIEHNLAGVVVVDFDDAAQVVTIEIYGEGNKLIDSNGGLGEILELARAGNFVPAPDKAELTGLA